MELLTDPGNLFIIGSFVLQGLIILLIFSGLWLMEKKISHFDNLSHRIRGLDYEDDPETRNAMKFIIEKEYNRELEALDQSYKIKTMRLSTLLLKIKAITSTLDANVILDMIRDILKSELEASKALVLFYDKEKQIFIPIRNIGLENDLIQNLAIPINEESLIGFSGRVVQPVTRQDALTDSETAGLVNRGILKAEACFPLATDDNLFGMMTIIEPSRPLNKDDINICNALASISGLALNNAEIYTVTTQDLETSKKLSEEQLRQQKQLRNLFTKYVSESVVEQLINDPESIALGGKKQKVTLYFSDIRGFTAMSEKMLPEDIVSMLNEYLSVMSDIIMQYGGTLDKYMGDAIMAIYGAPIPYPDSEQRAVATGIKMQQQMKSLNEKFRSRGLPELTMGIGINTGYAVVGNIGSEKRMEYTAIGDPVNVASRICSIAASGEVMLSETTWDKVKQKVKTDKLDPITVKGKSQPIDVYRVIY